MADNRPTLEDVARIAGVHPGTASRALNADTASRVLPDTAQRIREAAASVGYAPNAAARQLRRRVTHTIGVLIPDLTNPFFPPIVRGIEDELADQDFTSLVANTDFDLRRERRAFDALMARQVDGFIVCTAYREHRLIEEMRERGLRVVLVQRLTDRGGFASVSADDVAGVGQVVRHLVGLGHRRLAHLAGPDDVSVGYRRTRAFLAAAAAHGVGPGHTTVVTCSALTADAGYVGAHELLDLSGDATAVFASNDLIAVGAMRAMRERGIRVPHDLSLVGFNDVPMAQDLQPALTTVQIRGADLGREAARMLLGQLRGESTESQVVVPADLVVRDSTSPPRRRPGG